MQINCFKEWRNEDRARKKKEKRDQFYLDWLNPVGLIYISFTFSMMRPLVSSNFKYWLKSEKPNKPHHNRTIKIQPTRKNKKKIKSIIQTRNGFT